VYHDESNSFKNMAIPFSDGRKTLQIVADIEKSYQSKGVEMVDALEKSVTLAIIDNQWKEHLRDMDDLRSNVQHARFEQKDPLLIYKFESYELFKQMINRVNAEAASFLMKAALPVQQAAPVAQPRKKETPRLQTSKAGVENLSERMSSQRQSAGGRTAPPPKKVEPIRTEKKVGRNDPCPCGSGKKYKQCHGKNA
jgi:preprotein translocase subunit SecA